MSQPTVLITGAARRIGRGIALHLSQQGFSVAIHYNRSIEAARETAALCGDAPIFQANLESVPEIIRLFSEVESRLGRLPAAPQSAYSEEDAETATMS